MGHIHSLRRLQTSRGFALLATMVSLAVAGIGLMSLMGGFSTVQRATASLRESGDFTDLANSVRMALANPHVCRCNLAPAGPPGPYFVPASGGLAIPAIELFDESCEARGTLARSSTVSPRSGLWVQEIQLRDFSRVDDSHYFAKVRVTAAKSARAGGYPLQKEFIVQLDTLTSGSSVQIVGCLGTTSDSEPGLRLLDIVSTRVGTNLLPSPSNPSFSPPAVGAPGLVRPAPCVDYVPVTNPPTTCGSVTNYLQFEALATPEFLYRPRGQKLVATLSGRLSVGGSDRNGKVFLRAMDGSTEKLPWTLMYHLSGVKNGHNISSGFSKSVVFSVNAGTDLRFEVKVRATENGGAGGYRSEGTPSVDAALPFDLLLHDYEWVN